MAAPAADRAAIEQAAAGAVRFDGEGHAWVAVGALETRFGQGGDAEFGASLQAMIAKARPFGWISEDGRSIRAHVEWF